MYSGIIDRRVFLKSAGAAFISCLGSRAKANLNSTEVIFASAYRAKSGNFGIMFLDENRQVLHNFPLPARGHDITFNPAKRQGVVFARRPGNFALVFDLDFQHRPMHITTPENRHFYGHGVFSRDGKLLYAAENDFENARGIVGLYDATFRYKRIGEFSTYGTGPHEILLHPEKDVLIVANGGIETHPEFGRAKLNISTMDPSLVFLDLDTGLLVEKHRLPASFRKLSIRHMDVSTSGQVVFGCQYEGSRRHLPPLVGSCQIGEAIELWNVPPTDLAGFANYTGSVALSRDQKSAGVTMPKGNRVAFFNVQSGELESIRSIPRSFGISRFEKQFAVTAELGVFSSLNPSKSHSFQGIAFDNHISRFESF